MSTSTHILNPNTEREIAINGVHFLNLLKHGFKYNEELNWLYNTPLPLGTPKYIPKSRMISPNNRYMIIEGLVYFELLQDNYKPRGGKWWRWGRKRPKSTIVILAQYLPRTRKIAQTQRLPRRYRWIWIWRRWPCDISILGHLLKLVFK